MDSRFFYLKSTNRENHHILLNTFKAAFPGREDLLKLLQYYRLYPDLSWQRWIDGEGGVLSIKDKVISIQYDPLQYQFTSDLFRQATLQTVNDLAIKVAKIDNYFLFSGLDQRLRIFKEQERINPFQLNLNQLLEFINY